MDDVNQARAELARLESVEQGYFRQMLATHRAVKVQRSEVEGLIRKQNLTIHCLPNELLVLTFSFAIARPTYGKKFNSVHYLDLVFDDVPTSVNLLGRAPFYQPFPNTRHAKFSGVEDLRFVITSTLFSGNPVGSQKPVDDWASLERLTIPLNTGNRIEDFDLLLQWLEIRQEFGLPKLHVKLTGRSDIRLDPTELYILCSKLRRCCILELECIQLSLGKHYAVVGKEGQLGLDPYLSLSFVDPAFVQRRFSRWKREESESESESEDEDEEW
ncbi:hypothetical protein EDD17DRAFT_1897526 [Pisolithus thermaeus]|nr:hypothetical protein EDD17DRAFT_1897526 [Pisolithus thermaeus]